MSVNSNMNKELLYDLLSAVIDENGFLIDITTLQSFLDTECDTFEKNKTQYNSLSEINKNILDNSYKFLLENQLKHNTTISVMNEVDLFDKEDNLNNSFKIAKNNFENTIKLKKPDEINFEDDELPPENLENIMNQTLADRENELNNITRKYSDENKKKAENWINKDNIIDSDNSYSDNSDNREHSDNMLSKPRKSVSFEEPVETFNIFNKLKKKQNIDHILIQMDNKINKILSQQKLILELLTISKDITDDTKSLTDDTKSLTDDTKSLTDSSDNSD
jgi:hypothetical protein